MGLTQRSWFWLSASWGLCALAIALSLTPVASRQAYAQETETEEAAEAEVEETADEPAEEAAETPTYSYLSPATGEGAPWPDAGGGAAGYWTTPADGPVGDGLDPSTKTAKDLYDRIAHNMFSINMVWTLVGGFLVMFMQFGFMAVETGLCRAKNSSHTSAMNFMIYPLGCIAFWAYGFALGWGNWWNAPVPSGWYSSMGPGTVVLNEGFALKGGTEEAPKSYGLFGTKGFFLHEMDDVSVMALFFFMMVFMDTTATIPTGTMAERWAWKNFCLFGLWVALPYCLYAHWVWGGGWLAQAGSCLLYTSPSPRDS